MYALPVSPKLITLLVERIFMRVIRYFELLQQAADHVLQNCNSHEQFSTVFLTQIQIRIRTTGIDFNQILR
jgi:hypothetical protein